MTSNLTEEPRRGPLADVREGMPVVDASGASLGVVEAVKMGDPGAVTAEGQTPVAGNNLVGRVHDTFAGAEPDVPGELASRLLRVGYVKIDGRGLLDRDRYAAADQVAGVSDDTVHLAVTAGDLATET